MTANMQDWLGPQDWHRDSDTPCLTLGPPGTFDDNHIFAPCVAHECGLFRMWYCGARGSVRERVFKLGLATSRDGLNFRRHAAAPVMQFDETHSILTPTLLRRADGALCREHGRLRMWFSSCDFPSGGARHTLHETASDDGLRWDAPGEAQMEGVYAPTIIRESGRYRLWYACVTDEPWSIRYAESADGRRWEPAAEPVLAIDQGWEHQRLFYPTVLKRDGLHLMWYGSYSNRSGDEPRTALGFAVSQDGLRWRKHPDNPVFGPDPSRGWESHYTTSQTVLPLPDGSLRIWYAARPTPPFVHKYFAIGTARWEGGVY